MSNRKNDNNGTVYPFLDARTPMADSPLLPVKLSVSLNGSQFRVGIKVYSTKEIFEKATSLKGSMPKEAKVLKAEIDVHLEKAKSILEDCPNITQQEFLSLFKFDPTTAEVKEEIVGNRLAPLFQEKIGELIEEDRAGSLFFYQQALLTFERYQENVTLEDVTVKWLKKFRADWLNKGNSNATAQIHFRSLRHIYNRAIKAKLIDKDCYPFEEFKIGTTTKSKDVLYPEQLKMLWNYEARTYGENRAKDYFFFLYLCNGMNVKDALHLKGSNIKGDLIKFNRAKTENTSADSKEIVMHLHPEVKRIIHKWGSYDTNDYIFPCLRGTKNNIERKHLKDVFARNVNRDLRPIGKKLGFEVNLTLNLARHSFATRLKLDGTPTSFISDALGHSSSSVTEHYMKSLPSAMLKKISDSLLEF